MTVVCLVQDESDLRREAPAGSDAPEAPASVARWAAELARRLGRDLVLLHAPLPRGEDAASRKATAARRSKEPNEAPRPDAAEPRRTEALELELGPAPASEAEGDGAEGVGKDDKGSEDAFGAALRDLAAAWTGEGGPFSLAAPEDEPAAATEGASDAADVPVRPRLRALRLAPASPRSVVGLLGREKATLCVLAHREADARDESSPLRRIFREAACATLWLRPAPPASEDDPDTDEPTVRSGEVVRLARVLAPVDRSTHAQTALRLARDLAAAGTDEAPTEAATLYVQGEVGADSRDVGRRVLGRIVTKALGSVRIDQRVRVAESVRSAVIEEEEAWSPDLLLVGASQQGLFRARLRGTLPGRLLERSEGPAVGVARGSIPLAGRVRSSVEHVLASRVPQLDRERRVELVESVQGSSSWNFDFVALVALSTAIAALGLLQNSAAVVIGAMLIAPLMTPLIGVGLAVVQGNLRLLLAASRATVFGFALALGIGAVLGLLVPDSVPTHEMQARGAPNLLDLAVAGISGLAAAYATSRRNLSSALPGVAIAAALVPPTATCGLALSLGEPSLAFGAALLFLTNIVAIVLGSATSLWVVGIRGSHQHGREQRWVWAAGSGFLLATLALVSPLSRPIVEPLPARTVSASLREALRERAERAGPLRLAEVEAVVENEERVLVVTIEVPTPPPRGLAGELAAAAAAARLRESTGTGPPPEPPRIRLVSRLVEEFAPPDAGAED